MTVRERVLEGLGQSRCARCQRTGVPLEIDHLVGGQGEGKAHRAQLKEPLERWLWRQYQRLGHYPSGYQVLCVERHDEIQQETTPYASQAGQYLTAISRCQRELVEQLDLLAKQPGATKSTVIETALRQLVEGGANQTLVEGLHQALAEQKAALLDQAAALKALTLRLGAVETLVTTQHKDSYKLVEAANLFYDYVDGQNGKGLPSGSKLRQFFRPK